MPMAWNMILKMKDTMLFFLQNIYAIIIMVNDTRVNLTIQLTIWLMVQGLT